MKNDFEDAKLSQLLKPTAELQAGFERVNRLKLDLHTELAKEFSKTKAVQEVNELPMFGGVKDPKAEMEALRAKYPDSSLARQSLLKKDTNILDSGDYLNQEDFEGIFFAQLNLKKKLGAAFEALFTVAVEVGDAHESQKENMLSLLSAVWFG